MTDDESTFSSTESTLRFAKKYSNCSSAFLSFSGFSLVLRVENASDVKVQFQSFFAQFCISNSGIQRPSPAIPTASFIDFLLLSIEKMHLIPGHSFRIFLHIFFGIKPRNPRADFKRISKTPGRLEDESVNMYFKTIQKTGIVEGRHLGQIYRFFLELSGGIFSKRIPVCTESVMAGLLIYY